MTKWELLKEALKGILAERKAKGHDNLLAWVKQDTLASVLATMEFIEKEKLGDGGDD